MNCGPDGPSWNDTTVPRPCLRLPLVAVLVALACVALLARPARVRAQPAPLSITEGGTEVNILADDLQQIGANLTVATGNVELTQGQSRLLADRVELNRDTGEVVAQGKAVFYDGEDRLVGERIDYNLRTGTGVVYDASTFSAPYYSLSGEQMQRIGPKIYNVKNGIFTTCEGDEPDWSVHLGSATADLNDIVYGRDASFWVKNVPLIPWLPFFAASIRSERQSGFLFPNYAVSSNKGFFATIPYYWVIDDSQDLTVALDVFTKRGVGLEAEYRYLLSALNQGSAGGFFVRETQKSNDNRGYFSGQHMWQITPRTTFKATVNYTSDTQVYRDYADQLDQRARQRAETNVSLSQRGDTWNLVGTVLWYQDLSTPRPLELQRLPDIRFQRILQPVPGVAPLLYDVQASFVNFHRLEGPEGLRIDLYPSLRMPIPLAGVVTLTPSLAGRATYYDQRLVGQRIGLDGVLVDEAVHDDRIRRQIELGLQAESRASRVYLLDGVWGLSALQHVIEPRATLTEVRGLDQKDYPQYDPVVSGIGLLRSAEPNIDHVGKVNAVEYSITNRLNAKTTARPDQEPVRWEAARFTVAQIYDIGRAEAGRQPFADLRADFIAQPTPDLRFSGNAAWNTYGLGLREFNTDVSAKVRNVTATVSTRFNEVAELSFINAEVTARLLANLSAHASTNYDERHGAMIEGRVGFDLNYQCWAIMVEYVHRHDHGDEVRFAVNLLGLGQAGTGFTTGLK